MMTQAIATEASASGLSSGKTFIVYRAHPSARGSAISNTSVQSFAASLYARFAKTTGAKPGSSGASTLGFTIRSFDTASDGVTPAEAPAPMMSSATMQSQTTQFLLA